MEEEVSPGGMSTRLGTPKLRAVTALAKLRLSKEDYFLNARTVVFMESNATWPEVALRRGVERPFFEPEELPLCIMHSDAEHDTYTTIVHDNRGLSLMLISADKPAVIELRKDGVWESDGAAAMAEIFVRLRRRFPGAWERVDVRREIERNNKQAKRAGWNDPVLRIPREVEFYTIRDNVRLAQITEDMEKERPVKQALRVAVIGGDKRVEQQKWPDDIEVQAFNGEPTNAARIVESAKQGKIDRVILLARWNSHSIWTTLRAGPVPVVAWPHGIPRLAREMHRVLGIEPDLKPGEVAPDPAEREDRDSRPWREPVLAIVKDYDEPMSTADVLQMVGMPSSYQDVLAEALEHHVQRGAMERDAAGRYSIRRPTIQHTPPLPGPPPKLPAPITIPPPVNGNNGHAYPLPEPRMVIVPTTPSVPEPDRDDEEVKLAEAGARFAVKRAHLVRYKKRRAALAAEIEKLDYEIIAIEQEVQEAAALIDRYAEAP